MTANAGADESGELLGSLSACRSQEAMCTLTTWACESREICTPRRGMVNLYPVDAQVT